MGGNENSWSDDKCHHLNWTVLKEVFKIDWWFFVELSEGELLWFYWQEHHRLKRGDGDQLQTLQSAAPHHKVINWRKSCCKDDGIVLRGRGLMKRLCLATMLNQYRDKWVFRATLETREKKSRFSILSFEMLFEGWFLSTSEMRREEEKRAEREEERKEEKRREEERSVDHIKWMYAGKSISENVFYMIILII